MKKIIEVTQDEYDYLYLLSVAADDECLVCSKYIDVGDDTFYNKLYNNFGHSIIRKDRIIDDVEWRIVS